MNSLIRVMLLSFISNVKRVKSESCKRKTVKWAEIHQEYFQCIETHFFIIVKIEVEF